MVRITEVESFTESDFLAKINQILSAIQEEDLKESLRKGFLKHWERPPLSEMELILGKRLVIDEVRQILFFPGEQFAPYYVPLLSRPPDEAPQDHPTIKALVPALSMLYLIHVRDWTFVRSFIIANGLAALVDLMMLPNLYMRSQAVDIFMQITNVELYDWFAPHNIPKSDQPVNQKMLELSKTNLIKNLFANSNVEIPSGSFYCLQLFAFYASWIRLHHCHGNILPMSTLILESLRIWSQNERALPEERELAKTLFDDFSRIPGLDEAEFQAYLSAKSDGKSEQEILQEKADAIRKKGNEAFSKGNMPQAIELYSESLRLNPKNPDAFSNRAAAKLKLAKSIKEPKEKAQMLDQVIADCDEAVKISNKTVKAYFRKATALIELNKRADALVVVKEGLTHNPNQSDLLSLESELTPISVKPKAAPSQPSSSVPPQPQSSTQKESTQAPKITPMRAKQTLVQETDEEAEDAVDPIQRFLQMRDQPAKGKKKVLVEEL